MLAEERQKLILLYLNKKGSVNITKLMERFKISRITAWRDLKILEEKGLINKVYGGALIKKEMILHEEPPLKKKLSIKRGEKELIARYAANNFVQDSDVIILGGGSTVMRMVPHLKQKNLTILTAGFQTMVLASEYLPHFKLHCSGGMLREESMTFVGPDAEDFFSRYNANIVFMSCTGISIEGGIMDADVLVMQIKRAMCHSAKKIVLLVDSSKFNKMSLSTVMKLEDIDVLVTDDRAPENFLQFLKDLGIIVEIVKRDMLDYI